MIGILGIIVVLTQLGGYYAYYLSIDKNVKPNTTSWTIWTIGSVLELISYAYVTSDWVKSLLPIACSVACIILYINLLKRGKFQKLSFTDKITLTADFVALGLWYITDSALVGNIALQVSTVISFIPIYRDVYDKYEIETQPPWIIWTIAYSLDVVLVVLRWEKWGDLAYPLTNAVLHFIMWLLVFTHLGDKKAKYKNMSYEVEPHLFADKSKVAGTGLFTSKKIKKGELAFTLKGPKLNFSPANKEESMTLLNIVGIEENLYIAPFEPYVYINHRCDPNLVTDEDGVSFIALRDIEAGEELTFDYSISEYSAWEMECGCGASECRKVIKSIEKLPLNFYRKYYPFIPSYFQKIYLKNYIENSNK